MRIWGSDKHYIYIYIDTYSVYKYWSLGLPFLLYFTQILLFIPSLPYSRFRKNWVPFTKVQTFQILLAMDSRKNNSWNLGERNTPCFFQAPVDDLPPLHSSGIIKKLPVFWGIKSINAKTEWLWGLFLGGVGKMSTCLFNIPPGSRESRVANAQFKLPKLIEESRSSGFGWLAAGLKGGQLGSFNGYPFRGGCIKQR